MRWMRLCRSGSCARIRHNRAVIFTKHSPRWTLWVFAAALLLKSAMPFLASASARVQHKALVEVCTVYGVALVAPDGDGPAEAPAHDQSNAHAGDHCALTALAALAPAQPPLPSAARLPTAGPPPVCVHTPSQAPDASAMWVARLKHGPPHFS